MYVAAAATEALTARRMSVRNEARACLAMARNALRVSLPGPPPAAQVTATQGAAPLGTAMPIAAHKALVQASGLRAQPVTRHNPQAGRHPPNTHQKQPGTNGAPRQRLTQVDIEDADKKALVSVLMAEMPAAWRASHYARVPMHVARHGRDGHRGRRVHWQASDPRGRGRARHAQHPHRLVPRLRNDPRVDSIGGHDGRHVIPEGARVMKLPRWSMRDTIGYWRSSSAVADETDADAARTAALHVIPECARVMTSSPGPCKTRLAIGVHQAPSRTKQTWMRRAPRPYVSRARVARARMGWGRYLSDRYSSQVGQVIEGEESRVACLMAIIWPSKPGQAPSHRAGQQPATGQRYRASRTR